MTGQELVLIGRLLLAVVLGGLIGLERQIHGRPAGLRTHILVCIGSALVMILVGAFGPHVDPGRAIAGVVTGVGFLGAGVIVKSEDVVRGLTTAACIWFVAALGIASGQGLYAIAGAGTVAGLAVLILLDRVTHRLPSTRYHTVVVGGQLDLLESIEGGCRQELENLGYRIVRASSSLDVRSSSASLVLRLRTREKANAQTDPSRRLLAVDGVWSVNWD